MGTKVLEPFGQVGDWVLPRHAISVRSMNFGQHWRGLGAREVAGTLWIPCSSILNLVTEFLLEMRTDSESHPDDDDKLEVWLRAHRWPRAEEVMESREGLALVIDYLAHDILHQAFADTEPHPPGVVLNRVQNPSINDGVLQLDFEGREAGSSTAYQD